MSLAGHQSPPIFKRGPAPRVRLFMFVSVCLVLLVSDLRFRYLEVVRQGLSIVTYPLQLIAASPANFARDAAVYFATLVEVQLENADLRREQLDAARKLLRFEQLEQENTELRALLAMANAVQIHGIAADILYDGPDPFVRRVILDRGAHQGIDAGLAVVDAYGLIGQVTRVYPTQAEVTLLTDKEQAVPVMIERSGVRGVLFGSGRRLLELRFISANSDIRAGDRIVTSGLDGIFLAGVPVAEIVSVEDGDPFMYVLCKPVAQVSTARQVLVLGRAQPGAPRPDPAEALDAGQTAPAASGE